ncbi:MAG TPA: ABC transporter, partial [Marmoricola sp.]|nr:ABC transporter [Marmoricola sp.]
AGKQLLEQSQQDLSRASRDFRVQAERMIRDWQQGVIDLVRTEGADKRTSARFLAYGVNGLAVALMVVSFASTGGLVGAEIGIAGGSAIIAQKLLEAVFGDQAVRRLAQTAHTDLLERIEVLFDVERARFTKLLDDSGVEPAIVDQLRGLARRIDDLRFSDRSLP